MDTSKKSAVPSQVQYLSSKLRRLENKLNRLETKQQLTNDEIKDLYFQKGKLYSELELMKRVPKY
jgi:predicted nuclease with TOPRIM domain